MTTTSRAPEVAETLRLARDLLRRGQVVEAAEACEAHLGVHGEDTDVRFVLGAAARMAGRPDLAVEHMRRAADRAPQTAQYWRQIVLTAFEAGRPFEAVDAGRRYFALASDKPEALELYGLALIRAEKSAQAADLVQKTILAQRDDIGFLKAAARVRRALEDYEAAADLYARVAELDETDLAHRHAQGECEIAAGRHEDAVATLLKVSEKRLLAAEPWVAIASAHRAAGDDAAALDALLEALERDAAEPGAHKQLVELLWSQGREEDVRAHLSVMLDGAPESLALKHLKADVLRRIGDVDKAEEAVLLALIDHKDSAELYDLAARIAFAREDFDLADERHKAALELRPYDVDLALSAARTALRREEYDRALRLADYASRCDPTRQHAYAYGYAALKKLGKDEHAARVADADLFVKSFDFEPPADWEGGESAFYDAVRAELDEALRRRAVVFADGVVKGARTTPDLHLHAGPALAGLLTQAGVHVERYMSALPADDGRAFLRRRPRAWRFSGVSALRLEEGGSAAADISPRGWLSVDIVLTAPTLKGEEDESGASVFNEPPEDLGLDLERQGVLRPKVGEITIFPSAIWRGVRTAASGSYLALQIDIRPAG